MIECLQMTALDIRQFKRPSSAELQQRISRIYDHLYANASTRTPSGISKEVGKLLHVAMFIEETLGSYPAFNFSRSEIKELNGGRSSFASKVASSVRRHLSAMNKAWCLYSAATKIDLEDKDIGYVCGQLNGIVISDKERDVFGDALEIFRSQWAKITGGQFFTDQRVTSLAMTLLEFDPRRGDDLIDICAGTGGFLLAGINHIRELLEENSQNKPIETELVRLAAKSLKGMEVDNEVCKIANATLTSRLSTMSHPFVTNGDSLQPEAFKKNIVGLKLDHHLCAASNPPFGTKITIKDPKILKQFDLARMSAGSIDDNGQENGRLYHRAPDILFLEQNIRMLSTGRGRLAIVLPYQILSGPQTLYVRKWLLRHVQLLAVIDLPAETFQPHTGTKTSLVVMKRRKHQLSDLRDMENEQIFMSMPRWIGHDRRGHPIYQRSADGKLTDQILTDFNMVEAAFSSYKKGQDCSNVHEMSFSILSRQVAADPMLRINALFCRPSIYKDMNISRKQLRTDWSKVKIEDVTKRIFYPPRFKRNYVDYFPGAVPFLGGSNITEMIVATDKWLSPDDPKLEQLRVRAGWLLVTRSGSTGIISSVPYAWDGFAMSEHVIRIIPDASKLDPAYLLAFLRTKYCQELLARGVFGSVIDEITPEFIGELEILVPKQENLLKKIIEQVNLAEQSRQICIEKLFGAVDMLNDLFIK